MSDALGSPFDPLQRAIRLNHSGIVYPLGFALQVQSNNEQVIAAANESWGQSERRFRDVPAVRLRVVVRSDDADELPREPRFYAHDHLTVIVSDAQNFASVDTERGAGFLWVSERTVQDPGFFRWFFLEAAVYLALSEARLTPLHAGCVARDQRGLLLLGASGAGKSTLAYACARRNWDFLSDDAIWLLRSDGRLLAAPPRIRLLPDAVRLFPELRDRKTARSMGGKTFVELDLTQDSPIRCVSECAPAACLFLKRERHATARMDPIARDEAYNRLVAGLYLGSAQAREEQVRSLEQMVKVPAFDFVYDSLDQAVDILDKLHV